MTPMKSPEEEMDVDAERKPHIPRATLAANEHTACEMCDQASTVDHWYVWDCDALDPPYIDPLHPEQSLIILCSDCHRDEMTDARGGEDGWSWLHDLGVDVHVTKGVPGKPHFPPKCNDSHWAEIAGPDESYGYLRLASERGGKFIDINADYLLGFSSGWADIKAPTVELWSPGDRPNTIPVFDNEDKSAWPPSAFITWPDMGPPPPNVLDYARWAHAEWKSGKNIQFGCYGAHGRTGTFLGLLFILAGVARTGEEAVELVRTLHCKDAIETKSQEHALVKFADEVYAGE